MKRKNYQNKQYNKQGMELFKKCLITEIKNPCMNIGRLLLFQCPRKMKKYSSKYPTFKTTRPISVTGVY